MKKFFGEFKEFIMRGSVIDMAVGVVIGGAFRAIIDSLVSDIIMPCISILTGKVNIAELSATIIAPDEAKGVTGLVIPYGNFIQQILNFLIIAFVIFVVIKIINTAHEKLAKKEEKIEEMSGPTQEELLTEIRDLLKKGQ